MINSLGTYSGKGLGDNKNSISSTFVRRLTGTFVDRSGAGSFFKFNPIKFLSYIPLVPLTFIAGSEVISIRFWKDPSFEH